MKSKMYSRKAKVVEAVQWEGSLAVLPKVFRDHRNASSLVGKIEVNPMFTVLKRGNVTAGIKIGDWLLRDDQGRLEVMSNDRFQSEYELLEEMEGGVA